MESATEYGYDKVFGKYLDENVREICLEEPYIKEHFQVFFGCFFSFGSIFIITLTSIMNVVVFDL